MSLFKGTGLLSFISHSPNRVYIPVKYFIDVWFRQLCLWSSHTMVILCIISYSSLQRPRGSLQMDDGEYWSNRAACYKGKSHRPIFENNMDKIYRNLYKKACSSVSHTQESFWNHLWWTIWVSMSTSMKAFDVINICIPFFFKQVALIEFSR